LSTGEEIKPSRAIGAGTSGNNRKSVGSQGVYGTGANTKKKRKKSKR